MVGMRLVHRIAGLRSALQIALFMVLVGGCSEGPRTPTQVLVYVDADASLAARAVELQFRVNDEAQSGTPAITPVDLEDFDISPTGEPIPFAVAPQDDAAQRYRIEIELLEPIEGGLRVLASQTIVGGFVESELREVRVTLENDCRYNACEEGFRCYQGQCVEHCVEPAPPGEVTRSSPVTCSEPCTASGCFDGQEQTCDDGVRVLEQVCGVGCDEVTQACRRIMPSNLKAEDLVSTGLGPLVVGDEELGNVWFDTFSPQVAGGGAFLRYETENVDVRFVNDEGQVGCDGGPLQYAVFSLDTLHVLKGAVLTGFGGINNRSLVIVATGDIRIDGTVSVAANGVKEVFATPGSGGCPGGAPNQPAGPEQGSGGGGSATATDVVDDGQSSGGAGGSFGTAGGSGGDGRWSAGAGGGSIPGGEATGPYGNAELTPLVGGSGGGAGTGLFGGDGGGAVHLVSLTGRIIISETGLVNAGGGGGGAGNGISSGGGGGSGGAILLEAGALRCPIDSIVTHFGAPGGGGGGGGATTFVDTTPGQDGHPRNDPAAPGGEGVTPGGNGSDVGGVANDGATSSASPGGGGGGGAGRVRINTLLGEDQCEAPNLCGVHLYPTTCGNVMTP